METVKDVYILISLLPNTELYGLRSQMGRAAVSIPSNIAEGCSRQAANDQSRFFDFALGSLYELETQLLLVIELYPAQEDLGKPLHSKIEEEARMLYSLRKRVRSCP